MEYETNVAAESNQKTTEFTDTEEKNPGTHYDAMYMFAL